MRGQPYVHFGRSVGRAQARRRPGQQLDTRLSRRGAVVPVERGPRHRSVLTEQPAQVVERPAVLTRIAATLGRDQRRTVLGERGADDRAAQLLQPLPLAFGVGHRRALVPAALRVDVTPADQRAHVRPQHGCFPVQRGHHAAGLVLAGVACAHPVLGQPHPRQVGSPASVAAFGQFGHEPADRGDVLLEGLQLVDRSVRMDQVAQTDQHVPGQSRIAGVSDVDGRVGAPCRGHELDAQGVVDQFCGHQMASSNSSENSSSASRSAAAMSASPCAWPARS